MSRVTFFDVIKKSFLTLAICSLLVLSSSSLTYAQSASWDFNLEWISFSATWWWGWWWLTAEQLQSILQAFQNWWTWWWVWWNWIYWWDWTWFNYAERDISSLDLWNPNAESFRQALRTQIQTFQWWSYSNVEWIDLDNNWFEEIIATNWDDMLIFEWNWSTFRQSRFYWMDKLNKNETYFLRLEDEIWNSIYYLMHFKEWTFTQTDNNIPRNNFATWNPNRWTVDELRMKNQLEIRWVTTTWSSIIEFPQRWNTYNCIRFNPDLKVNCNYVTVDNNWLHHYTLTRNIWEWEIKNWTSCWWNSWCYYTSRITHNLWRSERQCDSRGWQYDRKIIGVILNSSFTTYSWTNYFRLYWKALDFWPNKIDKNWWNVWTQLRCNNKKRNFSILQFLQSWNQNQDYWYMNWKFFMKNDDRVNEYYNSNWSSMKIWWYTVYRYTKEEDSPWNGSSTSFPNPTTSEKKPQTSWATIATSEYDRFVTKANSDWTYNYKITLEKPDWTDVVAFYWLNFNWILFKDINWDWVKDIMTYEDYVSEDNIKFKRVYLFIFDPSDYIYKKVLDWVDTISFTRFDIDNDWDLDILIRRYDQKLYFFRNNNLQDMFTNLWAVRWTYFLLKDIISNWKHQIITKNMPNNWVAWEWKVFNIDWNWLFNVTWNYENWLVWTDYKTMTLTSQWQKIDLFWIKKATNQYKVVYYNDITWLYENFPMEFYIKDLTSSYISYVNWNVIFINTNSKHNSFYKDSTTWKYLQSEVYYLSNWITIRATETSEAWHSYRLWIWENDLYYVAENTTDIQTKIWEWFDSNHIVTTKLTNLSWLFKNNITFNGEVSSWDTEKVTNMSSMFQWATSFNQPILNWNTNKVDNISNMFNWATSFNQDLSSKIFFSWVNIHSWTWYDTWASSWTSSNKPILKSIFTKSNWITKYCESDLPDWEYKVNWTNYYVVSTKEQIKEYLWWTDSSKSNNIVTSKVTDMSWLFYWWSDITYRSWSRSRWPWDMRTPNCENRNVPNSNNTRRVRERRDWAATTFLSFNWQISSWDTSNVTTFENMFRQNHCFNQDISKWDTSNVTNMNYMFTNWNKLDSVFNKNISWWNVSNVTTHEWLRCNWCTLPTFPS